MEYLDYLMNKQNLTQGGLFCNLDSPYVQSLNVTVIK